MYARIPSTNHTPNRASHPQPHLSLPPSISLTSNHTAHLQPHFTPHQTPGVDVIHPGYGFLSENAQFARRCAEEGITFVGPLADTIQRMGDKTEARKAAMECGVPVVPGVDEAFEDVGAARVFAEQAGYVALCVWCEYMVCACSVFVRVWCVCSWCVCKYYLYNPILLCMYCCSVI